MIRIFALSRINNSLRVKVDSAVKVAASVYYDKLQEMSSAAEVDGVIPVLGAEHKLKTLYELPGLTRILSYDTNDDSPMGSPYTARGYGQTGNGALAEFVLKRQLGDSAVRSDSTRSSAKRSITYSLTQQTELEAPEPGRLRLLSGITASFEPGTLNAVSELLRADIVLHLSICMFFYI